jgi:arylsulfatase A-like enzyme
MRNGIYPLTIPADAIDGLPSNETTLAEHLHQAGYTTM